MNTEPLVILVEPSPAMQEVLKADLEEEFLCRVVVHESVTNVRKSVIAEPPALIVLDIETPAARRFVMDLKDDPDTGAIPVIGANLMGEKSCTVAVEVGYDSCFTADLRQLERLARKYLPPRPLQQSLAV